jgi:hypothetical protein
LPILKDELAVLEKLLPELETRPDLGHFAIQIKKRLVRFVKRSAPYRKTDALDNVPKLLRLTNNIGRAEERRS